MVRMVYDSPCGTNKKKRRQIAFDFDYDNENDIKLIENMKNLCLEQPSCWNCINFYQEGCFCGYTACFCKIHGSLENINNPYHDMDGSKCKEYIRKMINNNYEDKII